MVCCYIWFIFYPNHGLIITIVLTIDTLCIIFNIWTIYDVFVIHLYAITTIIMGLYYYVVQQYQPKLDCLICDYKKTQTKNMHQKNCLIRKHLLIQSKQNYRQLVYNLSKVMLEHFRYVQIKNVLNDELLSNYLLILFIANLPTSIYLITKIIYKPIGITDLILSMFQWINQFIICLVIVITCTLLFKMLNSISHRLYCSQLCIKSNILLKWNTLSYYEMVHSNADLMAFKMGTIAEVTNKTGFKVRRLV